MCTDDTMEEVRGLYFKNGFAAINGFSLHFSTAYFKDNEDAFATLGRRNKFFSLLKWLIYNFYGSQITTPSVVPHLTVSAGTNTCQIKRIKFALLAPDCCKITTELRNLTCTSNASDSLLYSFHAVRISSQVGGRTTETVLHSSMKNWRSIKSSLHLQLLLLPVPPCGLHPSSFEQVCLQLPAFLAGPRASLTNTECTQMHRMGIEMDVSLTFAYMSL